MKLRSQRRRGNSVLEFTLVGIPLILMLISIFEVARGMWIYNTLAHAVREGTRFAIVHGQNCAAPPNACQRTVADVAAVIRDQGVGLAQTETTVTLKNTAGATVFSSVGPALLSTLLANTTVWPSGPGSAPGNEVAVTATYKFRSAILMFWPGAGGGMNFPAFDLPAVSRDRIQF